MSILTRIKTTSQRLLDGTLGWQELAQAHRRLYVAEQEVGRLRPYVDALERTAREYSRRQLELDMARDRREDTIAHAAALAYVESKRLTEMLTMVTQQRDALLRQKGRQPADYLD